jgi:hypothetical protein
VPTRRVRKSRRRILPPRGQAGTTTGSLPQRRVEGCVVHHSKFWATTAALGHERRFSHVRCIVRYLQIRTSPCS